MVSRGTTTSLTGDLSGKKLNINSESVTVGVRKSMLTTLTCTYFDLSRDSVRAINIEINNVTKVLNHLTNISRPRLCSVTEKLNCAICQTRRSKRIFKVVAPSCGNNGNYM